MKNLSISNSSYVSTPLDSVWEIEKSYSADYWNNWFGNYWKVSLILSIIYIVGIRWASERMKHRKRFQLQGPLFLWNVGLAVFSVLGASRTVPELLSSVGTNGWIDSTICTRWGKRNFKIS